MAEHPTATALVLAGGSSRRMGTDKRALSFDDESFLNRAIATARSVSDDVWLLVSSYGDYRRLKGALADDVNVAVDRIPNAGPMSALAGLLPHLRSELALLLAVDYPLLRPAFLRGLLAHYESTAPRPRVLVPQSEGQWHVTCALYATSLGRSLVRQVDRGERSLWRWLAAMPHDHVQIVDVEDVDASFGPEALTNVNTPAEYRRLPQRGETD